MIRTYMIRHARPLATWGDADPDPGLDEVGRAQALAAAEQLMALPADVRPKRVLSSPMRRAIETAEPFARMIGAEIKIDDRVGEIPTPPYLEPDERGPWLRRAFATTWFEVDERRQWDYVAWAGYTADCLIQNAGAAVFSHFVALNAAVGCALNSDDVMQFHPDHASITVFGVGPGPLDFKLIERGREAETRVL
jgi:broad specificity phosphatase PhoE